MTVIGSTSDERIVMERSALSLQTFRTKRIEYNIVYYHDIMVIILSHISVFLSPDAYIIYYTI